MWRHLDRVTCEAVPRAGTSPPLFGLQAATRLVEGGFPADPGEAAVAPGGENALFSGGERYVDR